MSIGISGSYLDVWRFSLNYTHFFGAHGPFLDQANPLSFDQHFADRDFIAISFRRTF